MNKDGPRRVSKFEEGQVVRDKRTGRIGIVSRVPDPPWDVYVSVRFRDGTIGYELISNFERTKQFPKFNLKGLTQKIKKSS